MNKWGGGTNLRSKVDLRGSKLKKMLQLISSKKWEDILTIEQGEIIRKRNKEQKWVLLRKKNIKLEMKKKVNKRIEGKVEKIGWKIGKRRKLED